MASIVVNGDTSGAVTLSAPAVAGTVTVTLPATTGTMLTTASSTGISGSAISSGTVPEAYGGTGTSTGYYGFKNRIINGAMGIWQRGTSFTSGGSATYTADRFFGNGSSGTISRSTDVPAGFIYSFSNAASSTAYPGIAQRIESVNIADCASQAITVSFYVKQTSGTASALNINLSYPTAVDNYAASTSIVETTVVASMTSSWTRYSYTYTLPANVTNGLSVTLFIPNASITATFLITGIQVEKGSTATSFDYRPFGTELQLCQRYLPAFRYDTTGTIIPGIQQFNSTTTSRGFITFPVTTRASTTGATVSSVSHFVLQSYAGGSSVPNAMAPHQGGTNGAGFDVNFASAVSGDKNTGVLQINNSAGYIYFTGAEL